MRVSNVASGIEKGWSGRGEGNVRREHSINLAFLSESKSKQYLVQFYSLGCKFVVKLLENGRGILIFDMNITCIRMTDLFRQIALCHNALLPSYLAFLDLGAPDIAALTFEISSCILNVQYNPQRFFLFLKVLKYNCTLDTVHLRV